MSLRLGFARLRPIEYSRQQLGGATEQGEGLLVTGGFGLAEPFDGRFPLLADDADEGKSVDAAASAEVVDDINQPLDIGRADAGGAEDVCKLSGFLCR